MELEPYSGRFLRLPIKEGKVRNENLEDMSSRITSIFFDVFLTAVIWIFKWIIILIFFNTVASGI